MILMLFKQVNNAPRAARFFTKTFYRSVAFGFPLREPRVYTAAAQLLGSVARVYYAFFAVVPGGGGRGLPWHQDNM